MLSVSSCSILNDKNPAQHNPDTWSPTHRHTLGQAARCCQDNVIESRIAWTKGERTAKGKEREESVNESERCALSRAGEDDRGVNVKRTENRKHKKVILEMCEGMKRGIE